MMNLILQFIFSFFASFSFGFLFNIPRRHLFASGATGAFAWLMYYVLFNYFDFEAIIANFFGAITLTAFSILFTKLYRAPIIVFVTCGLIPLVPGGKAYETVRAIVQGEYAEAIDAGFQASLISFSIAMGIIITEMVYELLVNIIRKVREKNHAA